MKCKIIHESRGRLRVHLECARMSLDEADVLEYYMRSVDGVDEVKVYDRTRDAVICYRAERAAVINALAAFSFSALKAATSSARSCSVLSASESCLASAAA